MMAAVASPNLIRIESVIVSPHPSSGAKAVPSERALRGPEPHLCRQVSTQRTAAVHPSHFETSHPLKSHLAYFQAK